MEIFDLYDKNRIKLNKTMVRGSKPPAGTYRMVVHLAILHKNKMLIQRRSFNKKSWTGMWDITCGGSAIKGETSSQAIHRELKEELGLDIDFSNTLPFATTYFSEGFDDLYVIEKDVNLKDLVFQEDEVCDAKWATKNEIKKMIKSGEFVLYYPSEIDYIFEKRSSLDRPVFKNKTVR